MCDPRLSEAQKVDPQNLPPLSVTSMSIMS